MAELQKYNTIEQVEAALDAGKEAIDFVKDVSNDLDDFKDGYSKNGNNIFDAEKQILKDKENCYAAVISGHISFTQQSGYKIFCIPVKDGKMYSFSSQMRFVVATKKDKYTATSDTISNANNIDLSQYPETSYIFVSFNDNSGLSSTLKIVQGTEFKDGFIPPSWLGMTNLSQLGGKVTANMMDGYKKGNIFDEAELYKDGYYVGLAGGHLQPQSGSAYCIYILKVDPSKKYTFTNVRFALPLADDKYTSVSNSILDSSTIDMSLYQGVKYIAFSFSKNTYPIETYVVSEGTTLNTENEIPSWIEEYVDSKVGESSINPVVSKVGTLDATGKFIILGAARSNLRKGIRLVFEAVVDSGTDFELGFSNSETTAEESLVHNVYKINQTSIQYYARTTSLTQEQQHGLNITGNVQVVFEYLPCGNAKLTLISKGESYEFEHDFTLNAVAVPYVKSNGLVSNDCKLVFTCTDFKSKIWCFGDSYFAYAPERWTYYLHQYGYDNVLLDGYPGMGSVNAYTSIAKMLLLAKPKFVLWFEGMNDYGDQDDNTPSSAWSIRRDQVIQLCAYRNITLIFATIPNVPTINHNGKNNWIKSSGYRYIDMCHAVGADVDVNWYDGMLASDGVHPTEKGAKALFAQVLLDFPEIMIDNLSS